MKIEVKLVGLFQADRFKHQTCDYPAGTRAKDIFIDLHLPVQHLGIVLVNGVHVDQERVLADGDHLVLMPLLGGG